jgi:hypothetical protein
MPMASQAPYDQIRWEFKTTDSNRLLNRDLATTAFRDAVQKLLATAGYTAYNGIITGGTGVKATAKTQGLRVGTPSGNSQAVEMTWQEGSNDGRYSFLLSVPRSSKIDKYAFHQALKVAEAAIKAELEGGKTHADPKLEVRQKPKANYGNFAPPAPAKENNVFVFKRSTGNAEFDIMDLGDDVPEPLFDPAPEESIDVHDTPAQDDPAALSAADMPEAPRPPAPTAPHTTSTPGSSVAGLLATAPEHARKFIRLCVHSCNDKRELTRVKCMQLLVDNFAVPPDRAKAEFESLIGAGYLRIVPNLLYIRLDNEWLVKHSGLPAPAPKAPAQKQPKPPVRSGDAPIGEYLEQLAATVDEERSLRARLLEITSKDLEEVQKQREALAVQIAALEDRHKTLANERNTLSKTLEDPRFAKAKTELARARAALSKLQ